MKTSTNNPVLTPAVGNGVLLLTCDEDGALSLSRYGAASLVIRPVGGGSHVETRQEGGVLHLCCYGLPPAADPTLSRTAVTVTVTCHSQKPEVALEVLAAHDLTLRLSPVDSLRFARSGDRFWATSLGLLGVAEGQVHLNEDEGALTFTTGYSRLKLRLDGEHPALPLPSRREPRRHTEPKTAKESASAALCRALRIRQSAEGGFCLGEGPIAITEQCALLSHLISEGDPLPCDAFFHYIQSLLKAGHRLPHAATADGRDTVPSAWDGSSETALLLAMKAYAERFGLSRNPALPALAGEAAETLVTAYRGKTLPKEAREALAFALSACRQAASKGRRFRIASLLDHAACRKDSADSTYPLHTVTLPSPTEER